MLDGEQEAHHSPLVPIALGLIMILSVGGLGLVAVVFLLNGGNSPNNDPFRARIQLSMAQHQRLGRQAELNVGVTNLGARIPDLVLWFSDLSSWNVRAVSDSKGRRAAVVPTGGSGSAYSLGPLLRGGRVSLRLPLEPVLMGRPLVTLTAFANVDATGAPDSTMEIHGDGERLTGVRISR